MTADALLAYFHFAAIGVLVALLAAELALCTRAVAPTTLRNVDAGYGLAALLVLTSGAARAIWGAKGSAFYLHNPVFHAKVGLFVLVGLISIYPTVQYFRWVKGMKTNPGASPSPEAVAKVRSALLAQLGLLTLIPVAAVLMARGVGAH